MELTKKENVYKILKNYPNGVTIPEMKKITKYSRHTLLVILAEMKGEKSVNVRKVGQTNLFCLNKGKEVKNE